MKRTKKRNIILIISILILILGLAISWTYTYKPEYFNSISYYYNKYIYKTKSIKPRSIQSIPQAYPIMGIDVSRHQNNIQWKKLIQKWPYESKPLKFVLIKASEGKSIRDKKFHYNWKQANDLGLLCGAYHYYSPNVNSLLQFNNFKSSVTLKKGNLPPILDIEERGDLDLTTFRNGVVNLIKLLENHYGTKPIIYASPKFYLLYLNDERIQKYPYWMAYYGNSQQYEINVDWAFWQFTNKGVLEGIDEYVDLNVFKGSLLELQKFIIK